MVRIFCGVSFGRGMPSVSSVLVAVIYDCCVLWRGKVTGQRQGGKARRRMRTDQERGNMAGAVQRTIKLLGDNLLSVKCISHGFARFLRCMTITSIFSGTTFGLSGISARRFECC